MQLGIKQWAKEAGNRIGNTFIQSGMDMNFYGWKQGPHTISFFCGFVRIPKQQDIAKMEKMERTLSYVLDNLPVVIRPSTGRHGYAIQVQSPIARTPTAQELVQVGSGFNVAVGYDIERNPIVADLDMANNFAWIGPPGKGKSESVRTTLSILLSRAPVERANVYVIARKPGEWSSWMQMDHVQGVVGKEEAGRWLDHLAYKVLTQRSQDRVEWPRLFVVLDDFAGLLKYDSTIEKPVMDLAYNGRAAGIRMWYTTQEGGTNQGTSKLDSVLTHRIVYRPPTGGASYRATGVKKLDLTTLSPHRGDAYAILDGDVRRCATGWKWQEISMGLPRRPLELGMDDDVPDGFEVVHTPVHTPVQDAHVAQAMHTHAQACTPLAPPAHPVHGTVTGAHTHTPAHPVQPVQDATPPELPPLPEILERREPSGLEEHAIIQHVLAYFRYHGEWPSQAYLIREVYDDKRDTLRNGAMRAALARAKRSAGQEFGAPVKAKAPAPVLSEEEELFELIRSGKIADLISAAPSGEKYS